MAFGKKIIVEWAMTTKRQASGPLQIGVGIWASREEHWVASNERASQLELSSFLWRGAVSLVGRAQGFAIVTAGGSVSVLLSGLQQPLTRLLTVRTICSFFVCCIEGALLCFRLVFQLPGELSPSRMLHQLAQHREGILSVRAAGALTD